MRRFKQIVFILTLTIVLPALESRAYASEKTLAMTPPMGWNSWNAFEADIDEKKIREVADAMVSSGMRDEGYTYLVLDDGWMAKKRDKDGRLVADPEKFPNGMKAIGDYIHSKGLKYGIYQDRGKMTCQQLPGSFGHERIDMETFARWGVDYIKMDSCFAENNGRMSSEDYALYRKYINAAGRPMVLSISDFGNGAWAWGGKESAQLWRTSNDIYPWMGSIYACAETSAGDRAIHPAFNGLWQFAGPGHWNDPDMLQIGNLKDMDEDQKEVADRAHFSLWCILAAPLMAGNDLRTMSDKVCKVLTAPELIAVNQDRRGVQGYKIFNEADCEVYNKPLADGTTAVLLLNKSGKEADITVHWDKIGLSGNQPVRDLWLRKNLGEFKDSFTAHDLGRHEHRMIKVGRQGPPLPTAVEIPPEKYTVTRKGITYLSDLYYIWKSGNAPLYNITYSGEPIKIDGRIFKKGLGCKSKCAVMFKVNGRADRFRAIVAMDKSSKDNANGRFRVYNEDFFANKVLWDGGRMTKETPAKEIDIEINDVQCLMLVFDGKDVLGNWADARVIDEAEENAISNSDSEAGIITAHSRGLHGYIGYSASRPPERASYSAGMGFYSAVWPLIAKPIAHFQIGLPSAWITPDNSDNKDTPLAPIGTLARDNWPERGPTWDSVFQTVEGGLGYWARNRFRYGPPKFSMNATPQCYDYEIGSPGWSFFYSSKALPDNRLGIAQLSNRLLIPPDALPFEGNPNGKFLGYTYMALPFTKPTTGDPPTGDQAWTCFLSAANFKGPIAYYIPETWSKIGKLFNYPFIYGRGLDARPGRMGGGAMEINTVPRFDAKDTKGVVYSKIPRLQFPVDNKGRTLLVQDVTYYSKAALYDAFKAWRDGGPTCSGRFDERGAWKSTLKTRTPRFDQAGKRITGVEKVVNTKVFGSNVWGLEWYDGTTSANGYFPQYFKHVGERCVVVSAANVPRETRLLTKQFRLVGRGDPYTSPKTGAWTNPGPKRGPFTVDLTDGSIVTYYWYRFIDQPSFQQYKWSEDKRAKLQAFVENIHANWPIDRDYMAPPSSGSLATLDPALIVTPPEDLKIGYVPIVTRQEDADQ